jgi:hypothetical protein
MAKYEELYQKYLNGEIDAWDFVDMAFDGKIEYDFDETYEKPKKQKKVKKMKKEDE